ncbi:SDR family oxidoreductase [Pelagibacterales bacterium SAG-MED13]|nr:SDR family oxidoreductase [Pelagibacterales bacterium SAG-MED13]
MKTILISGGGGYLGTYLTQELLKNYKVTVYDGFYFKWLFKNKRKIKYNNRLKFIKKDINQVSSNDFKGIDVVCDLNGIPNDPSSELNKKYTWNVNYKGRKKFAKIAKNCGVKRYIFNSTCAVYGYNKKIVNENSITNPLSTYAKANLKAEKEIYQMKNKNFKVNILRNSTLFGFSQNLRLDLVINIFVNSYLEKRRISVNGDGKQWRPFISLTDVAKIYKLLIGDEKYPSFITNLVAFNSTIKDLALKVIKYFKGSVDQVEFNRENKDNRNYRTKSINLRKYFKSLKFSSFSSEIDKLIKGIKKYKIKSDTSTVRMKFYKQKFLNKN